MDASIVTPEKKVWEGDAEMVVARSPEGEFAILRGHIPFLAALVPGRVAVISENDERAEFFVPGGFLEASGPQDDYHVIVLADDAEPLDEIDVEDARRRAEDAQRRAEQDDDEQAQRDYRAARARVEIAESRGR